MLNFDCNLCPVSEKDMDVKTKLMGTIRELRSQLSDAEFALRHYECEAKRLTVVLDGTPLVLTILVTLSLDLKIFQTKLRTKRPTK